MARPLQVLGGRSRNAIRRRSRFPRPSRFPAAVPVPAAAPILPAASLPAASAVPLAQTASAWAAVARSLSSRTIFSASASGVEVSGPDTAAP